MELIFSKKGFALSLVLKVTVFGTRQWPIVKYVYRILPLGPICPEEYLSLYQIPEFLKKVYINIHGPFSNCSNFHSSQSQKCPCHCFGSVLLNLQTLPQYVIGLLSMLLWTNFQPIRTNLSMHIFPTFRTSYTRLL